MHAIWTLIFYQPLYNALIFLVSIVPFHDVGFAVILLTIIVKLILFPITRRSIVGQLKLKGLEGKISEIKKLGLPKEEEAKKTFALYKENKVNPFSSCILIIIQLPILIALYLVFYKGLGEAGAGLYSFVHLPTTLHTLFLGLIDMSKKSLVLALLAGFTQFLQVHLSPVAASTSNSGEKGFKQDLAKTMQVQMKFILPIFIFFASYRLSAAVALYWTVNNIFTILQELIIRRKLAHISPILVPHQSQKAVEL